MTRHKKSTQDKVDSKHVSGKPSRRLLLQTAGVAALGTTIIAATAAQSSAAPPVAKASVTDGGYLTLPNVGALKGYPADDGDIVFLSGYNEPGDGGMMFARWNADSDLAENGGTVFTGKKTSGGKGRWLQLHDGVGDFRRFGLFDDSKPADDALDAMVNDPSFHRVEAHTNLNFVRRHTFHRSNVTLDFGGNLMTTEGITADPANGEFDALLFFQGIATADVQEHTLAETMPELIDVFEVADSGWFAVDSWYAAQSDTRPKGGNAEREFQRLVRVTEIVDGNHIRVNYKNGWELAPGRKTIWRRVEPVANVSIENMQFLGTGSGKADGSHPIAYEFAIHCDAHRIHATKTFFSVVMRRWCTYFTTSQCTLKNPVSVKLGGAGYLTQQMYCLYGHVVDCHVSRSRHLNDWTASSYCLVENCHGDGDNEGPFVTHGQYEHDLFYTGNSGLMTFANSGPTWGGRAKRITVTKHVAPLFFARVGVIDLTLEDVQIIKDPHTAYEPWFWVNADGVQIRGCRSDGVTQFSQATSQSKRPNIIDGSVFSASKQTAGGLPVIGENVKAPLFFSRTTIRDLDGATTQFSGTGDLSFDECTLVGKEGSAPLEIKAANLRFRDSSVVDTGFNLVSDENQSISISGATTTSGTPAGAAFFARGKGSGTVTWNLDGATLRASGAAQSIAIESGSNRYRAVGTTFEGGAVKFAAGAFTGADSYFMHSGCVEVGVTRNDMPADGPTVITEGNLVR